MTEDEVRDYAGKILGFEDSESTRSGVGQLTTFNQLGFKGIADKPDGWYLPNNKAFPAIILEVKSTNIELNQKQIDEIIKNCIIAMKKYKNVIGILYNGIDVKVYKNLEEIKVTNELQNKEYYLSFFNDIKIDKQRIKPTKIIYLTFFPFLSKKSYILDIIVATANIPKCNIIFLSYYTYVIYFSYIALY